MKDALFNVEKVSKIAREISTVYKEFEEEAFKKEVLEKFPLLELKERIYHIRDSLATFLPDDFQEATEILLKALPPELDSTKSDDDFGDFIYASYSEFVRAFGCHDKYLDFSLLALAEMTKRFSVEFAIRDFINYFPQETYAMLEECARSKNYHQRRLASEGLRLKLPWANKIEIDYHDNIPILDNLYHDKCRFVTRSVANHLNDISKIDAKLVLNTLDRWQKSGKQESAEMAYIIAHALRTLVKKGDEKTLEFLGFSTEPLIQVHHFNLLNDVIMIGESLVFSCEIASQREERLVIDYILYFRTKAGKLNPKVHKLKKLIMKEGESTKIEKKHLFKAGMTTRKFYAGEHKIALQINGKIVETLTFNLNVVE